MAPEGEQPVIDPLGHMSTEEEAGEEADYIAYIVLLTIMVIYVTVGTAMEKSNCKFGHETGVVIIIGILTGAVLVWHGHDISTEF